MPAENDSPTLEPPAPARLDWGAWLAFQVALAAVIALLVTLIWAAAGFGAFWPRWVWLGLAVPLALQFGVRRSLVTYQGRRQGLAISATVFAVVAAAEVLGWMFGGFGYFWPIWSMLAYGGWIAVYACVVLVLAPGEREQALEQRVDVLTRTRRGALDVQAAELRRIERDLHDGAQARLVSLSMQLGRAEERLADRPDVADLVRQARGEAGAAIAELRDLARGIAPPVLADRGLVAAVEALGRRSAVPVTVEATLETRPPAVLETAAYFVVAEALTNVAKHAPNAEARVTIAGDADVLRVQIVDDGPGGIDPAGGGLTGLRHRVEALDGTLRVESPAGGGTTICAELPCGS
jgi:signal transduction histidine kinase